jgi:hypothetical protein
MVSLLRTRVLAMVAGYGAQRDVEHLWDDPVVRLSVSEARGAGVVDSEHLPSQPTLARMHRTLGAPENLALVSEAVTELALKGIAALPGPYGYEVTVDIDSTTIETHGDQPGSMWNGHYGMKCVHPLVAMLAETGDVLGGVLRPGNEASSKGALEFLKPILDHLDGAGHRVGWVRGDAAFASNEVMSSLEDRGISYVFRATKNKALNQRAEAFLAEERGERTDTPREWVYEFDYKSKRWPRTRRILLVVQENDQDLFLHHYFLVTNRRGMSPHEVLEHYRKRGTMEARLGDLKSSFEPRISCTTQRSTPTEASWEEAFAANAGTFQLQLLAHGLLHTLRRLTGCRLSADGLSSPSLRRVRRRAIQTAGRLCRSGRQLTLVVAKSVAWIWQLIGERLDRLLPVT